MTIIGEFAFPDQGDQVACVAWRPTIRWHALGSRVLAVAGTRLEGTWKAYCDAVPGRNHDQEWQEVWDTGCQIPEAAARALFPLFKDVPYAS